MPENKQKQNTEDKTLTFTVIVDEDVAAYIEQEQITDTNGYMNKLLREERDRRKRTGEKFNEKDMNELIEETPDTSVEGQFQNFG